MKLTQNLKMFAVLTLIYSAIFFHVLYTNIALAQWGIVSAAGVVFFVMMFLTGLLLGMKDEQAKTRINLSFAYHLVTFIVVNAVHFLWFFADWIPLRTTFFEFGIGIAAWGLGLFVHYIFAKKSIKGYDANEVFE